MSVKEYRTPTTIGVDESVKRFIDEELEEEDFLGLGRLTNAQLMMFAMALGWRFRLNPDLNKALSGGFARTESFKHSAFSVMIDALHFQALGYENADELRDRSEAYSIAEKYANGGFQLIEGDMKGNKSDMEYAYDLIAWMSDRYEELFGN